MPTAIEELAVAAVRTARQRDAARETAHGRDAAGRSGRERAEREKVFWTAEREAGAAWSRLGATLEAAGLLPPEEGDRR